MKIKKCCWTCTKLTIDSSCQYDKYICDESMETTECPTDKNNCENYELDKDLIEEVER